MGNFFQALWEMLTTLIEYIGVVWEWLTEPLKIDIPLLSDIPLIGGWFEWNLAFSPIELLGAGILLLLALWLVKNLIPLG